MSPAAKLAARILQDLAARRIVPVSDQMHLRYLAHRDEVTLPIAEVARRILAREKDSLIKPRAAEQG